MDEYDRSLPILVPKEGQKLCPAGHAVGVSFGNRRCSGVRCAKAFVAAKLAIGEQTSNLVQKKERDSLPAEEVEWLKRKRLSMLPDKLDGEEATKWAETKLRNLLPEAVANIAHDLRYGTTKERAAAADRVLASQGLDKREAARNAGQGLIVLNINTGSDGDKVPWLERVMKASKKGEEE